MPLFFFFSFDNRVQIFQPTLIYPAWNLAHTGCLISICSNKSAVSAVVHVEEKRGLNNELDVVLLFHEHYLICSITILRNRCHYFLSICCHLHINLRAGLEEQSGFEPRFLSSAYCSYRYTTGRYSLIQKYF